MCPRVLVKDYMEPVRFKLRSEDTVLAGADAMGKSGEEWLVVVDGDGSPLGVVTAACVVSCLLDEGVTQARLGEIMDRGIEVLYEDQFLSVGCGVVDCRVFPVVDGGRRLSGVLRGSSLIRALKESLEKTREELNVVLDSTPSGIIAVDRTGLIITFNKSAEKLSGINAARAVGAQIEDVLPQTGLLEVLKDGQAATEKIELEGATVILNRTPICTDGLVTGAVAVFQDVTDLHRIAAELLDLRSHASTLETVLEYAYDGIVVVDDKGIITMFNKSYANFLDINQKDAVGRHITDVIENTRMHIVLQTGVPEIGSRQRIKNQDMIVQRIPIIKDGRVLGAVGKVMFKNITDLKDLAEKMDILQTKVDYYEKELRSIRGARYGLENIIGFSDGIMRAKNELLQAARNNLTVLIRGESGTGKELFAHAIHSCSCKASGPFIKVNCAAIPGEMLEAELFGYEEGAFTGARKGGKPGKFELAHTGTLFLDEIGDMPVAMQAKILRALQEKEVERLGGLETIDVKVRVVAATNKDLEKMVEEGKFREDLYYRLNVVPIQVPPLRERPEDMPALVRILTKNICSEQGIPPREIDPNVVDLLKKYTWPGNVRELFNLLERLLTSVEGPVVTAAHLPRFLLDKICGPRMSETIPINLSTLKNKTEKETIVEALSKSGGNRKEAARLLGIHRSTLYDKMNKLGMV